MKFPPIFSSQTPKSQRELIRSPAPKTFLNVLTSFVSSPTSGNQYQMGFSRLGPRGGGGQILTNSFLAFWGCLPRPSKSGLHCSLAVTARAHRKPTYAHCMSGASFSDAICIFARSRMPHFCSLNSHRGL